MTAPSSVIPAQVARDLVEALNRLRNARMFEDAAEAAVCERRVNWLLDSKVAKALKETA